MIWDQRSMLIVGFMLDADNTGTRVGVWECGRMVGHEEVTTRLGIERQHGLWLGTSPLIVFELVVIVVCCFL
jgi:hypothetical protein